METTVFKLTLSQPNIPAVPDTGLFTHTGLAFSEGKNLGIVILAIVGAAFLALLVTLLVRSKKQKSFGFSANRVSALTKSFMGIAAIGTLGCAGAAVYLGYGGANAEASTVDFASLGTVSAEGELDPVDTKVFCGTDTVRVNQATPAGYTLYMHVPEGELVASAEDSEAKFVSMEDELVAGTWGYFAAPYGIGMSEDYLFESLAPIPSSQTAIYGTTSATEADSATVVTLCAAADSEAEAGTYLANIEYSVVANPVNYTLSYDANGGTFATEVPTQESGQTIANSYTFTITDTEPVAPAGTALIFYGWSLTGDSLSDVYLPGETITVTDLNTTLKAVWGYERHVITYDKNTTDEVVNFYPTQYCIVTVEGSDSCEVKISQRVPVRTAHTLLGWSKVAYTPAEGDSIDTARGKVDYKPGDQITLDDDLTLHAIWWEVSTNDFQVELRWGERPSDLDSHLVAVRNSDGRKMFEVYYSHKIENIDNGTITLNANLDIDDMSSYGPETVTLNMLPTTAYRDYTFYYFIHNYSGEEDGAMKASGANITLIKAGGNVTEFDVASAQGASAKYWNVFAIKNGEIVPRNTLTNEEELSY